jgi:hypothetical protein
MVGATSQLQTLTQKTDRGEIVELLKREAGTCPSTTGGSEPGATASWATVRRLGVIQLGLGVVIMLLVFLQIHDRPLRDLGILTTIAVMGSPWGS